MSIVPPRSRDVEPIEPSTAATRPVTPAPVVDLGAVVATDPDVAGAKAAALAQARAVGLPVVPGVVITTEAVARLASEPTVVELAWRAAGEAAGGPLVVRSSSTVEDQGQSSMAGMFLSVLGVADRAGFGAAVADVVDSAGSAAVVALSGAPAPMAVLVQPQIDAVVSGVLFGADPVSGRRDRLVASIAEGTPDDLVSGRVNGTQLTLTKRGRVLRTEGDPLPAVVDRRVRRCLADLASATARRFGGPQDMEWALDRQGALWLLQSRPITTVATPSTRRGSVWGPAPVAETFPAPLRRLEDDLWIAPLAEGLDRALRITGAAAPSPRRAPGPLVRTVGGWVVADLSRLGADPGAKRSFFSRLNPRPPMWRLRVAWRVGRLRLAIGAIGRDIVLAADAALGEVPHPRELDDSDLIGTLMSARASLVSLNAHEALAGMLLGTDAATSPAASGVVAAHRALAAGRRAGWTDAEIVAREPSVLALLPASIPPHPELPATATVLADLTPEAGPSDTDAGVVREALRLRIRWTHALMAQLALEAGRRLVERDALCQPEQVADLGLSELLAALRTRRPCPLEVVPASEGTPPPDRFRLTADGAVAPLPASTKRAGQSGGLGAGGGRGAGEVWDLADGPPPEGAVVVTRFLDPGLAAHLPGLAGLVAETGSVLSHLAIVARELGIPTVVGAAGAVERFPAGTALLVDGSTGEVRTRSSQYGEQ